MYALYELCSIAGIGVSCVVSVPLRAPARRQPRVSRLQIKYITKVLKDTTPNADGSPRPFYDYLQSSLRHKSEMVMFQAARAIAEMKDVTMRELAPAITVLQLFLSSSKPVLRFTAVRTLNKVRSTPTTDRRGRQRSRSAARLFLQLGSAKLRATVICLNQGSGSALQAEVLIPLCIVGARRVEASTVSIQTSGHRKK